MESFWDAFRETVARLYGPLQPDDGEPESALCEAEDRLGIRLPQTLRDFYLLAGRRKDFNRSHACLRHPHELVIEHGVLVFYEDHQGVARWGIQLEDIAKDDPPVVRTTNMGSEALQWTFDSQCASDFLLLMLYWQAVNDGLEYVGLAGGFDEETIAGVEAGWPPVQFGPNSSGIRVFSRGGQVLCLYNLAESEYELSVAGRTEEDFKEIVDTLAIEWDLLPDAFYEF